MPNRIYQRAVTAVLKHPATTLRLPAALLVTTLLFWLLWLPATAVAERNLPQLSEGSSLITSQQERELGRQWLRLYRSHVPTSSDPLIVDYLEKLLAHLALHSQLQDRRLDLVVAENPTLNAFAVPGNVVGVHTGLLVHAQNEHQLASVLAHELAHLSQRHYARRLEQQRNMTLPVFAGILGGLVLAATGNVEAGSAAVMSTQAAAVDAQLRFSRQNEQEADRIGIQTLVGAGMDPYGATEMFDQMLHASRFTRQFPEFLRSHPITENRIADARNRAMRYPRREYPEDPEYQLVRTRILVAHAETPQQAVARFAGEVDGESRHPYASRYGLALSYKLAGRHREARETLQPLLTEEPERITYQLLAAEIDTAEGRHQRALERLTALVERHPNHYPAVVTYGEALMKAGDHSRSAQVLERLSRQRSEDPYVWYLLAEVSGLAGDILGVHEARAEYFVLNGVYDRALIQLRNAQRLAEGQYRQAILEERVRYVERQQQELRRL